MNLGVDYGGIHAIEAFVLARYFMFTQVYYHKTRRAYDFLLTDFIGGLLEEQTGDSHYPASLDEYLKCTDWLVLQRAFEKSDPECKNLAWRLFARQHPKPVYETGDHADEGTINRAVLRLESEVKKQFPDVRDVDRPSIRSPREIQDG